MPCAGSLVTGVQLSVGIRAAEGQRVLAPVPDGIGRRHEPILENAGESALRRSALSDGHAALIDITRISRAQ